MPIFKAVKKPAVRGAATPGAEISPMRPRYVPKAAPCVHSCTTGTDVRGWLVAIAQHKEYGRTPAQALEFAWRKILERNPFPAICGRVCQHPCELNCNRKAKEGPVAINRLERFVGDFAIAQGWRAERKAAPNPGASKVAIVGSGPAGLSAAYQLTLMGYAVTVIEAAPQPGGMMRYRIPRSSIPASVLDAEIANILQLGVELKSRFVVGRDISIEQLQLDYRAVFFATGLQKAAQLQLRPGKDGEACLVGALPAEPPTIPEQEPTTVDPRVLNTVSVAIAQGRAVAEAIAVFLERRPVRDEPRPPVIKSDKLKLDYYKPAARFDASAPVMGEEEVIAEATRCMSCGMCMDCEVCWMYCTNNCFVKLPKGQHFQIKLELCNGCQKCAQECPCGYIEMS